MKLFVTLVLYLISFAASAQAHKNDTLIHLADSSCYLSVPKRFMPDHQEPGPYLICSKGNRKPEHFEMSIYDYWGTKIYYTTSLQSSWNGKVNDKLASPGKYTWIIQLTQTGASGNEKKVFKGTTEIYY